MIPIMNAYENVDFAMRLAEPELTAKEVDERIRRHLPWSEWKSVCGICRDRCPVESNSGSQSRGQWHTDRRLCLQMNRPERWIPSLDFRVMQLFRNLIEKESVTIVMTTHDPNLMELGDVVYELEDGEIIDRQIRE